ncbi:MAG: hypothetical protein JEY91_04850 [Spirochaetaceae bacterium]|nr:hypothetical protein [Spirochaetaceae bacterium]
MNNILPYLIGTLFFTARFIIIPSILVLTPLLQILLKKSTIKKLGKQKIKLEEINLKKQNPYINLIFIPLGIIFAFQNIFVGLFYTSFGLWFLLEKYASKKYLDFNGIYEEGILANREPFIWNKIHSWKYKNKNEIIEILLKTGLRFDIRSNDNMNAVSILREKLPEEE